MQLRPVIHFTGQKGYHQPLPYHPPERFPELGFLGPDTDSSNEIYAGVRRMLRVLEYDAERFGTQEWSPLSDLAPRGGRIVLKPNFVRHYNEDPSGSLETVITHLAVLRPLIDYAFKAVGPEGEVVVADAPQYDCDVDTMLERNHLPEFLQWYAEALGIHVEFRDLRVQFGRHENGVVIERRDLQGDPCGYESVDLANDSEFALIEDRHLTLLRGADYDEEVTIRHHSQGRNEYLVSRTVLNADLVINCPKIKTHKKSGVTLSMKNLIGINGDKNWLPHYRAGFQKGGGDEFPRPDAYSRFRQLGGELARSMLKRGIGGPLFKRIRSAENAVGLGERARAGNWYGNDTIWRTCVDLTKILYFGDEGGRLGGSPARRVLNVYDGIVAGEGQGPMGPTARPLGLLAASEDPTAADVVLAWIMGFDWRRIPVLANAVRDLAGGFRLTGFRGRHEELPVLWIENSDEARELRFSDIDLNLEFEAHSGWKGAIERTSGQESACAS